MLADICFGSLADICIAPTDVCFSPESGHRTSFLGCAKGQKQTWRLIQEPHRRANERRLELKVR